MSLKAVLFPTTLKTDMDPLLKKVTAKDRTRLAPHLSNWGKLNEIFLLDALTVDDVNKMIVIEFEGKKRMRIMDRLIARFYAMQRAELVGRVKPWCTNKFKP